MHKASTRSVTAATGFRAAGVACGIKKSGKPDLALIVSDRPCAAAGVFTKNKLPGAPVITTKRHLRAIARRGEGIRAVVCNSGCANDATGPQGVANAETTCRWVAEAIGCGARQVLPASTGVIGPQLPMQKMRAGLDAVLPRLAAGRAADAEAARAIMTTDLVPKAAVATLTHGRGKVTIGGICKGSGMIAPNMATMLAFITTDAPIAPDALQAALRHAADASFNRMSVDAHTSPSDTVLVLANGAAGGGAIDSNQAIESFTAALTEVCRSLAYQIVQDGEGATRVFRVRVENARSMRDADRVGRFVIDSPLVKTAVHGCDPNWGRIVTAAANSGAAMRPERLSLHIGPKRDVCVFDHGSPTELSENQRGKLAKLMQPKEVVFTLDLGMGGAAAEWLGCDLSKEYVTINAEYTT